MTETRKAPPLPPLETFTLDVMGSNKELLEKTITARLIGSNSSAQDDHEDHEEEWAPRRFRCPRCRWMDVEIYTDVTDGDRTYPYLVYTVGRSDVPDESDRPRITHATNSMMVLGALMSQQRSGSHLAVAAKMALLEAAGYDDDLKDEVRARGIA
jgi:hypothetical protein